MDSIDEIIRSRRSIRKFQPEAIPEHLITEIIQAATCAPSGCNSQCWKFVAVQDKTLLEQVVQATEKGIREFYRNAPDFESVIERRIRHITFFKQAPVVIFVFMTHMDYYDPMVVEHYRQQGYSERQMLDALGYPDVLSVGAAIQNMLLTIEARGLGACWMNDPIVAARDISEVLGQDETCQLLSVIPVGVPAYTPRTKVFKPLSDVLDIRS